MFVTNEGSNSCCGLPQGECACEKAKTPDYSGAGAGQIIPPVQNKAAEVDDSKPAGGSLGIPVWNWTESTTLKRMFDRDKPSNDGAATNDWTSRVQGRGHYGTEDRAGLRTFNEADEKLPAGGALGVPAWNF